MPADPTTVLPIAPAPRERRPRPAGVHRLLDMTLIGEVCLGVTLDGYRSVLRGFLDDRSGTLAALSGALLAADAETVRIAAHAMKGAAASLGLRGMQELARSLEAGAGTLDSTRGQAAARQLHDRLQATRTLCVRLGLA